MNHKYGIAAALAAATLLLTACSDDDFWDFQTAEPTADSVQSAEDSHEYQEETVEQPAELRPQGSARTLEGSSVIMTVVMETPDSSFTDEELEFTSRAIDKSCRYLEEQGRKYGKEVTLYNYSDEHPDLMYWITHDEDATIAADSSLAYSNGYIQRIQQLLIDSIPLDDIYEEYGTDSVAFMVVYDTPGTSYSQVYYPGYDDRYYEWTALFQYDMYGTRYENLACMAHEILHLFGAVDLYRVAGIDGVTEEIYNNVQNDPAYEMALMYNTYNEDGSYDYDSIPQSLSEITLAMIGFTDPEAVYEKYPSLAREYTAAFEIKYY